MQTLKEIVMPHDTHDMNAYRDGRMWVAYCVKCSAESRADLQQECPGKYIRKNVDNKIDNKAEQD